MPANGDVPPLDTSRPSVARIYDYWLGGKNNFAADRDLAQQLERLYPPLPGVLRDGRAFVTRAVTWCAGQRIGQFLDLGCGLPPRVLPSVHETAQAINPDARVVYVDNDPIVHAHASALLGGKGVGVVAADVRHPAAVLADPDLRAVIDPDEPVCVLLAMVLHYLPAAEACQVVAGYGELLAPGSVLAVSMPRCDDEGLMQRIREAYTPGPLYNHSRRDIASFFAGLELVTPGVALAHAWRGGMPDPGSLRPAGPVYVLGGMGRKR
jgi:S-adenosyl methyltransferase